MNKDVFGLKLRALEQRKNVKLRAEERVRRAKGKKRSRLCKKAQRNISLLMRSEEFRKWLNCKYSPLKIFHYHDSEGDTIGSLGATVELVLTSNGELRLRPNFSNSCGVKLDQIVWVWPHDTGLRWTWEYIQPTVKRLAASEESASDFLLEIADT